MAAVAAGAVLLAGCAGLPRTVVITEAQLQDKLAAQFPQQRRVMSLLDLNIGAPALKLLPEQNRVAARLTVDATERLSRRSATGTVDADSALRFEPSDMSLRLNQVRVARFDLADAGGAWPAPVRQAAGVVAEQLLEDQAVWRASSSQADRLRRAGVRDVKVRITAAGIELTLDEEKAPKLAALAPPQGGAQSLGAARRD